MSDDDRVSNPSTSDSLSRLWELRVSRRGVLAGALAAGAAAMAKAEPSSLRFTELAKGLDDQLHVAEGHDAEVVIGWGDPVLPGAPPFDPDRLTAKAQEAQFGYNCDFVAFMPLPGAAGTRGLLCVNHEFTNTELMFSNVTAKNAAAKMTPEMAEVEMAAHGHSVVEIELAGGRWRPVPESPYNRRLTARSTPMRLSGPAAGHPRLQTNADPKGETVIGTLNNCAGGVTPWGTVLSGEENFPFYFRGEAHPSEADAFRRYGFDPREARYPWWADAQTRFDLGIEPREPNRFGWIVEIDPYDPMSTPVKRTALGRLRHEGATPVVDPDGRVVVYTGDDQQNEYVYKFVSDGRFDPMNPSANRDLLDKGTLFVARLDDRGGVRWLPLVQSVGPLTAREGFHSQADVVIEARRAADLLGATPMDRPEDIEVSPITGHVFVALTNNALRTAPGPGNPRAPNKAGQILELIPPREGGKPRHAATEFTWNLLLVGGDPAKPEQGARFHPGTSSSGWLVAPDNAVFDAKGRLWIATDEANKIAGMANGVYACDVTGPGRALTRLFLRGPIGSEICGPCFTPDNRTFFASIQHPAENEGSTRDKPTTRWPDFRPGRPPRPSVVAVRRRDGGVIGD